MVVAPQPVDPFAGIMAFPILPEATYSALDALGGGWMLPSADGLEADTAILLQTNPGFTAAFLRQEAAVLSRPANRSVPLGRDPRRRRRRSFTLDRFEHLYPEADLALRDRLDRIHEATGDAEQPTTASSAFDQHFLLT